MRLLAVLIALALAGCSGGEPEPADDAVVTTEAYVADGPDWQVGDWFGHHFYFGPEDEAGMHVDVMVVERSGDSTLVATDDPDLARWEAVYDIPILGSIALPDLSTTGFGATWSMYTFPMRDNMTWDGSISGADFNEQIKVEYQATYNPAIKVGPDTFPGFDIVGTTADGMTIVKTNYVQEIGWYTDFRYYDITSEDERWVFRSISMGTGHNWTGTYYVDTAQKVLGLDPHIVVDPTGPLVDPAPATPFTVPESTYLMGYAYAWTAMGVAQITLVDPNGEHHDYQANGIGGAAGVGEEIDMASVPGDWTALAGHAGIASGAGAHLWAVTETTGTLP